MSEPDVASWQLDGLTLAGLVWGPPDGIPVLALHGWMDHAESFAELAPRLNGCRVVAIDLSGQGLSSHRAPHASYNIWDDLPQIDALLDSLGWESCVLMGHSRGANIGALFAAALPERVRGLIAIDSLVPEPSTQTVTQTLRGFIRQTRDQIQRPPRRFDDISAYIARRCKQGNTHQTAQALADRALMRDGDGYLLRGDRRHFASSAMKLNREQIETVLRAIGCPVLNIWAEDGIKSRPALALMADFAAHTITDYQSMTVPGDHHAHMEAHCAGKMAEAICAFVTGL